MIQWVIDYYDQNAELILPFLEGRKIGIRQIFKGEIIYRRHQPNKRNWIYIKTKEDLLFWVKWHGWAYFPHLEGENDLWFAMDIDRRSVDFQGVKIAAAEMAKILDELNLKYLVKFSGANGFHFLWRYQKPLNLAGKEFIHPWQFEHKIIEFLQTRLEEKLQKGKQCAYFYKFLKKNDPITFRSANDPKNMRSILIDEYILKTKATIRAPYSLHEKSKLVSVPIKSSQILSFNPKTDANPKKKLEKFNLPFNNPEKIFSLTKNASE